VDANRLLTRRTFVADLGRGAFALAIVGLTGCASALTPGPSARPSAPGGGAPSGGTGAPLPGASGPVTSAGAPGGAQGLRWDRVNLGNVSAYILVRGGEAAIVDTGNPGSADAIERSLTALGLGWSAVGHLVLTHRHGDHVGSAGEILARAPGASGYAGAEEVGSITVPRPLKAVAEGDKVFDLTVVTAPGHTAGSICVFDPVARLLVAGDAMGTSGGKPTLPGAQFTSDMTQARQSVVKLGGLAFETLLVGHGDPIMSGASALVIELGKAG
jgi:glyoxylase-like metal-dependent hydrolase (beta-lactamase superfamily II)